MTKRTIPRGLKVGVLMGGLSNEREISLKTGSAVLASLGRMGVEAVGIDVGRDLADQLRMAQADVAFVLWGGQLLCESQRANGSLTSVS